MYLYILFGPAGLWPHNFGLCAVGLTKDSVMSSTEADCSSNTAARASQHRLSNDPTQL